MKPITLVACLMFGTAALAAADAGAELFQKAVTEERAAGNLEEAIKLYQRVAKEFASDRALAAKALVQEARCYEKLGQDKAVKLYEQVARDYNDQREPATQARARLAALRQDGHPAAPATMTQRRIEITYPNVGPGDTDGHRVVYEDRATGELIYGDVAGNSKRVIFKAKPDELPGWSPSKDFSMVFLRFHAKRGQPQTFAVVNTDGTGYREIVKLDASPTCWPSWSWDNRYLLCAQSHDGASRLLRISVADGQTRELLNLKTGAERAGFSPDGRFVAYQVQPTSDSDPVSRIFILPAEGGAPQLVYEERLTSMLPSLKLLDWTADGRYLAVASERTGKGALHLVPIKDGKSVGAPVFVKFGDFELGATTSAGGLIYRSVEPGGAWAVYLAALDANSRPGVWKRLDLPLGNTLNPEPQWSGDSNQIVYSAQHEDMGQTGGESIRLRNLSAGGDREIYHALGYTHCMWASQQPKVFCAENGVGKTDILSISVDSGQVERLHNSPGLPMFGLHVSRDDRALYTFRSRFNGEEGELQQWEIATQRETVLERMPPEAWGWVSPDERWVVEVDERRNLKIRPTAGGDWKPLLSDPHAGHFGLTPDGNWLIYHTVDSAGKHGLYRVSTAGGQPERLGDFPTNTPDGSLEISPDGRKVMVAAGEYDTVYELWSLENFVPPAPKP
ncbi:MAG: hypothetical protein ABSF54_18015 [Bryobacteraceae bacterium]|jgi:Tol biopolymer transport system component